MDEAAASTGKRGRKQQRPDPADGPVAAFAFRLCELKEAAGDPSYDRMRAEFGAAASKSALSAAARGRDLPSWETTWEFVRSLAVNALDQDAEAVRREWTRHWEEVRASGAAEPVPDPAPTPAPAPKRRWPLIVLAVLVMLAAGSGVFFWLSPPQRPIPGDASFMLGEDPPDGIEVKAGGNFVKTWELRNIGQVRWTGRYLEQAGREGGSQCTAPHRVSIAVVEPGQAVRLSVPVAAGSVPGRCKIAWKMVDENGVLFYPASALRPIYFDVAVVP
ncbi:NBR1-Ig-like domain-containing protein [Saccharopolyspora shandongensis]|uniref:NBR1-Ig-like domain-containing protein n=1 Tax=Saccharopolyspora shandongensis TaxID=418495 RepID=UPI003431CFCE